MNIHTLYNALEAVDNEIDLTLASITGYDDVCGVNYLFTDSCEDSFKQLKTLWEFRKLLGEIITADKEYLRLLEILRDEVKKDVGLYRKSGK